MAGNLRITFVGHASVLIEMDGERILTDPLLRNRVWHLHRHHPQVDPELLSDLSTVLISHAHLDHLDFPSLRRLEWKNYLISPRGTAQMLEKAGVRNVVEISCGENFEIGCITITATQAEHDGARYRYSQQAESLGYLISGSSRIYFAGDTELFPEMADLARNLKVALLPVWGWGPNLGLGHMDPQQAAQALQLLQPDIAIPIHWGTFLPFGLKWLLPRILSDPPRFFASFAEKLAPEVRVIILEPGESIELSPGD
jgi:L-ascorbate metabolism protein UlaG (beta-lactamase superfamily)